MRDTDPTWPSWGTPLQSRILGAPKVDLGPVLVLIQLMWKKLSSSCQFYNFYLAQVYTKVGIQGVLGLGSKFIEIQVDVIFIPSFRRIKPLHRPVALIRDPRARSRTHWNPVHYEVYRKWDFSGYGCEVHPPQLQQMQIPNKIRG